VFIGAIESEFRRWFRLNREAFRGRTLFVGCSGNFTIEQLLGDVAGAVHSNDVSIYSHFLGHHLAGQETRCAIKDESYKWLEVFLNENPGAAIVCLFELLKWEPRKNLYQQRIYQEFLDTWEFRFEKTVEKVEAAKAACKMTSYRSSDIYDFADQAFEMDPSGVFLAFLPFYKGGYEKLYKRLDEILAWDTPRYEIIDQARKDKIVEKVRRFDHVIIDDVEHTGGSPAVMLKRKTATKQMWLYSNLDLERVLVQFHTKCEATYYPLITDADVDQIRPTSQVVIKKVKAAEINYYRNRYLAKGIVFADGMWNFLFFIDGKLFGFAILSLLRNSPYEGLYVLSDFAVPVDQSKRLSKLILFLLQSTHFRELCEELTLCRVPELHTTAFTEKPVSMKYRGAWELLKRGEDASGKKFLNYKTATGLHDDRQAIEKWLRSRRAASRGEG
jgi:hypothetical protein